ncbi:MAG: type I 3-dehydroquinate dehydratase [Candidatus Micrarchaeota archaeon]|nr:type I 3-dehydroquinate dehydratase [Candidatus Micrarchaeota archaeon]
MMRIKAGQSIRPATGKPAGPHALGVCHSIGNCSVARCISSLRGPQLAEVRLDLLTGKVGKAEVRRIFSSHNNLIATCRPGRRLQKECASLLLEAIADGAACIDIEVGAPIALQKQKRQAAQ